jgi:hypothetical protein
VLGAGAVPAAIFFQTAEDDPHEVPGVFPGITALVREPHAQGGGEAFQVLDPAVPQTLSVQHHVRAAS